MARGLAHLTFVGQSSSVDLAVPTNLAIAELVPDLIVLLYETVPVDPVPARWTISRLNGQVLAAEQTLLEAGVVEGDMILLLPDAELAPPTPRVDDVVEAAADAVESASGTQTQWPVVMLVGTPIAAIACSAYLATSGRDDGKLGWALLGVASVLVVIARLIGVRRIGSAGAVSAALAGGAFSGAAAILLLSGSSLGSVVATAGLGLAAWMAVTSASLPAIRWLLVGLAPVVVTMIVVGSATIGRAWWATTSVTALVAVLSTWPLPSLAVSVSGLAALEEEAHRGGAVEPASVATAVELNRGLLHSSLVGVAALAGGCLVATALAGSWWAVSVVVVLGALFSLRARHMFFEVSGPILAAGVSGLITAAVWGIVEVADAPLRQRVLAAAGAVVAAGLVAIASSQPGPSLSARLRAVADVAEHFLTVASVPVVAGLLGLYREIWERFQ